MIALPPEIEAVIGDADWQQNTGGYSGVAVYQLHRANGENAYLKVASHDAFSELPEERARLEWLRGRLPVPRVLAYAETESRRYLLISELAGVMACNEECEGDLPRMARLLASGLREIHRVPIAGCPFDRRLDVVLQEAHARILAGVVDESDFDEDFQGRTAAELYQRLLETRPATEDLVFTHGDYCLPNILLDFANDQVSGFIDWSRAGIADRYQDLALAARSLVHNFSSDLVEPFFQAYGIEAMDEGRAAFYRLLDEFF